MLALRNTENKYGIVAKFLHWLIFLLITILVFVDFFMGDISNTSSYKGQVYNMHKLAGI